MIKATAVRISRDGKRRATENILVERQWRSVKFEAIYLKKYRRVSDMIAVLKSQFRMYNHERPYQNLRGTPVQVHRDAVRLDA